MPRGLSKEKIIQATMTLAEQSSLDKVSFPRLAEYFDVKAPSLYNHFKNMSDVRVSTAIYLHELLNHELTHAMVGLRPDEALRAYAQTYRSFAEQHASVYDLLNQVHELHNQELSEIFSENTRLIRVCLENFEQLDETEVLHRSRMFRSTLHGYVTLSRLGYFQNGVDKAASFDYMVERLLADLITKR